MLALGPAYRRPPVNVPGLMRPWATALRIPQFKVPAVRARGAPTRTSGATHDVETCRALSHAIASVKCPRDSRPS